MLSVTYSLVRVSCHYALTVLCGFVCLLTHMSNRLFVSVTRGPRKVAYAKCLSARACNHSSETAAATMKAVGHCSVQSFEHGVVKDLVFMQENTMMHEDMLVRITCTSTLSQTVCMTICTTVSF